MSGAFVLGFLIVTGTGSAALALEKQTIANGLAQCNAWCDGHRSGSEKNKCKDQCARYWNCEGSDSTNKTCDTTILGQLNTPLSNPTDPTGGAVHSPKGAVAVGGAPTNNQKVSNPTGGSAVQSPKGTIQVGGAPAANQ